MALRDYLDLRRGYFARETRRWKEQTALFGRLIHLVGYAAWGDKTPYPEESDVFGTVHEPEPVAPSPPMTAEERRALTKRINAVLANYSTT